MSTGPTAAVDTAVGKRDDRAIYDASVDATVSITAKFADDSVGTASGFFVRDDGYVCTCAHAIQRPRTVENDDGELVSWTWTEWTSFRSWPPRSR